MRKYAYLVPIVGGRKVSHLEQNIEVGFLVRRRVLVLL